MSPVLTCISCGSDLPDDVQSDSEFCPHCGVSLLEATPIRTSVPPAPTEEHPEDDEPYVAQTPGTPPVPPQRSRQETNPFSAVVSAGPPLSNPFHTASLGGGLLHDENTPPIPTRADGIFTSARLPPMVESNDLAAHRLLDAVKAPQPPRPPSPRQENAGEPSRTADQARTAAGGSPPRPTPATAAPLLVHAGVTVPVIHDPHAEFRKGAWRGPMMFLVAAAALVGLFLLLPGGKDAERVQTREKQAVIGRSNSPEIIEEPPAKELSLSPRSEAPVSREGAAASDLSRFADDFKASAK